MRQKAGVVSPSDFLPDDRGVVISLQPGIALEAILTISFQRRSIASVKHPSDDEPYVDANQLLKGFAVFRFPTLIRDRFQLSEGYFSNADRTSFTGKDPPINLLNHSRPYRVSANLQSPLANDSEVSYPIFPG